MKNCIFMIFTLIFLLSGCAVNKKIIEIHVNPELQHESVKADFWLDEETGTVHRMEVDNGVEKVVSIIKYKGGNQLEVMKIFSSGIRNSKMY